MTKIKIFIAAFLLCLIPCVSGCTSSTDNSLKDNVVIGFNNLLSNISEYALTKEKDLTGTKNAGKDSYTGSYEAKYMSFNGKEYLFGGTALSRKDGNKLTVDYKINIESGEGKLYWINKDGEKIISRTNGSGTYSVTLNAGDNYLAFEGDNFTGTISVTVK